MFETCDICGIKFADTSSLKTHHKQIHTIKFASAINVLPVIGDGSTGLRGAKTVMPTRTSKRTQEQIAAALEDQLGIHNFHGYTIYPLKEEKIELVKITREEKFENMYVNFFNSLGTIEFDKNLMEWKS